MKLNILIYLLLFSVSAFGQSVFNQGSIISVDGAQFTIGDSLINNGTIVNNGNLLISGAWINNGTYDPGVGQITFNSDAIQTVNHNDQAFKRLTISGGGEKRFLANITIEDELVLESGNLISENGAKIIVNSNALLSGGSDQSHIVGPVEQRGSGDWLFPIGNGVSYLPVQLNNVNDETAIGILQLHELNTGESLTSTSELASISQERYWELNLSQGSLANTTLTLPLKDEFGLPNDPSLLVVAQSQEALGIYSSLGQSTVTGDAIDGSVTSENTPELSFFAVASESEEKSIMVYNGVSPNGDGKNDFLEILNIESFPNNKVSIFNRWGDKVFELTGYDNDQSVFTGENNLSGQKKLATGIYFYKIDLNNGSSTVTGYLNLKN